ncbi:MAG TPA: ABC transporter substrate-binding protein [Anaerolineae bacterium]|nr:ABC transporter substrate-binding protein [Anaerolineae bacterium]HPL28993.1 ABC transporter substrate-binding protein [Anaerolineae bacterium]
MHIRLYRLALLGLTAALLAGCAARPAAGPTKVTLLLDWAPNTNHTGFYVAQAQGWYQAQGLEVEIVEPGQTGTPVPVVAAGKADFGVSFQEEVTNARATDVPVVSIAAIVQHNTSVLVSLQDRGITRPKDLEGKKYASFGLPIERQVLSVLMKCDGGDVAKVQFTDIGASDPLTAISRDMDVAWIYEGWEGAEAERRNMPVNSIRFLDWAQCLPDYYTPVIVTSEQMIAQRPDVVRRFMVATAQGYEYAIAHPAEAAQILIEAAPEASPELIQKSQVWLSPRYQADAPRWGEQTLAVWQGYAAWLDGHGLLPRQIDATQAFTNEFLPA